MKKPELSIFSPLPPEENGIADYTHHLLGHLCEHFTCSMYVNDPYALTQPAIPIREARQAFRYIDSSSHILHQIGNNPGHVFVLEALRNWGGVTTLHDQNLHYLYEVAGSSKSVISRRMAATSARLGAVFARHWEMGIKTAANYALFDMLDEILSLSDAVIVHSRFAKRRLSILYGREKTGHVQVVPHLVIPDKSLDTKSRQRFGLPEDVFLVVTCGFATAAKRFDWLISALDELNRRGVEYFWVHAGKERHDEFPLSEHIERSPRVRERSRVTGYLSEDELNAYIAASDVLVNLRYPSVGESSGTLARAMAGGKCCVVSDTAAYSDIPRDAVVHIPIGEPIQNMIMALEHLAGSSDARNKIGAAARALAESDWSATSVASAYRDVILQATRKSRSRSMNSERDSAVNTIRLRLASDIDEYHIAELLRGCGEKVDIVFDIENMVSFAKLTLERDRILKQILPSNFVISHIGIVQSSLGAGSGLPRSEKGEGSICLRVRGILE